MGGPEGGLPNFYLILEPCRGASRCAPFNRCSGEVQRHSIDHNNGAADVNVKCHRILLIGLFDGQGFSGRCHDLPAGPLVEGVHEVPEVVERKCRQRIEAGSGEPDFLAENRFRIDETHSGQVNALFGRLHLERIANRLVRLHDLTLQNSADRLDRLAFGRFEPKETKKG